MSADSVISLGARWTVITGDNAEALPSIPDCSIDAIVTDPPAGIAFMGKEWDHHKGGRDAWIAWLRGVMAECLRVLKPGGHALFWAIPRTSHWTMTAVEDAGFEIRDCVYHLFGQGFPKSASVGKAIDKAAGAERPDAGPNPLAARQTASRGTSPFRRHDACERLTAPATPESAQWEGWGTALKPAVEPWILARKPLDGTVAGNVLKHGTGALNIDGCRVGSSGGGTQCDQRDPGGACLGHRNAGQSTSGETYHRHASECHDQGRFPAHLTLSHNPDCDAECSEGCAVAMLDAQSGERCQSGGAIRAAIGYGGSAGQGSVRPVRPVRTDSGGASRFFYTAKASRSDREEGLAGMLMGQRDETRDPDAPGANNPRNRGGQARANIHPTVKPTDLMRWLVRLITPPGGIVLAPFTGSGSTGKAAALEGMRFIGVERSPEYADIARARIAHAYDFGTKLARKKTPRPKRSAEPVQLTIDGVNAAE